MTISTTLILGGARSGKSDYAEKLARDQGHEVLYIATAESNDADMTARIAKHQASRPAHWQTLEAPSQVGPALSKLTTIPKIWIMDCVTLLVSNILLALEDKPQPDIDTAVTLELDGVLAAQQQHAATLILVSNEVGLGIVPAYSLGRSYRDVLGRANQKLAAHADRVLFMVAGLPMVVK